MKKNSFYTLRKNGFIYVARDEYGNLKIGAAHNVQKRIHGLRLGHPSLKLVASIQAVMFMDLERYIHLELEEHQIAREWFYCKDEKVILSKLETFLKKHGEIFGAEKIKYSNVN